MRAGGTAEGGTRGREAADALRAALAWWLGELADMVPARLKARAGSGRPAAVDCVVFADGRMAVRRADRRRALPETASALAPGEALAERLLAVAASAGRDRSVRLSVPRDFCLMRSVDLPARALPHAGAVLRHEIEALLPLAPDEILCDWYVETEDSRARRLTLRQVVLARPRIAAVEAALEAAGLRLARITVGDAEGRPVPVDLLHSRAVSFRAYLAGLPLSAKLLHALALALAVLALALASGRQAATLEAMAETRGAYARPSPAGLSASAVADFLDAAASSPGMAGLLDEVAARLPRDAFLTAFSASGETLALGVAGAGRREADALLRASPLVAGVETAGDDGETLTLLVTLRGAPAAAAGS